MYLYNPIDKLYKYDIIESTKQKGGETVKRSTYSVVLMDDVVAAIDALAAQMGTSRSNLMNQILAEHVCCITPEKRMRSILNIDQQFDIVWNYCEVQKIHKLDGFELRAVRRVNL